MDSVPVFASANEAMEVAYAALGYLAAADAAGMAALVAARRAGTRTASAAGTPTRSRCPRA